MARLAERVAAAGCRLSPRRRADHVGRRLRRRCGGGLWRSSMAFPALKWADTPTAAIGRGPSEKFEKVRHVADAVARQRLHRRDGESARCPLASPPTGKRSPSPPNRRSTVCRCRCVMRRGGHPAATRAATESGGRERRSANVATRSPRSRELSGDVPEVLEVRGEGLHGPCRLHCAQRQGGGLRRQGLRQSAQRRRIPAPARSEDHRLAGSEVLRPCPGARSCRSGRSRPSSERVEAFGRWGFPDQSAHGALFVGRGDARGSSRLEADRASLGYDIDGVRSLRSIGSDLQTRLGFVSRSSHGRSPTSSRRRRRGRSSRGSIQVGCNGAHTPVARGWMPVTVGGSSSTRRRNADETFGSTRASATRWWCSGPAT